ncbi:MAG: transketolase family protein [Deltaproteobacteria bacterium]|nr:transketolase family protein [Deltaproteobacteria bacterium]
MTDYIATRDAYGKALAKLGEGDSRVVVLDADLSGSTKTGIFAKKFPERFFNMGVAEQDLIGTAAGFALAGKIPFASSFAMFAVGRAWEIVRNSVAYPHLNVKICASHAGLTVGEDGASHQIIEDLALTRVMPGMTVLVPADATETEQMVKAAAAHEGPVYIRLGRSKVPQLFDSSYQFKIGKANVIREGKDILLIACGIMVAPTLEAARTLETQGIAATVVNCASIKPLDADTIIPLAKKIGTVLTLEEHSIIGGLGSAICELLGEFPGIAVHRHGVNDEWGQSAPAEVLLKHYKLMPEDIVERVKKVRGQT